MVTDRQLVDLRARVEQLQAVHGAMALETAAARHDLAEALHEAGELAAAEREFTLACEGFVRRFGSSHPFTLTCLNNLALVLRDMRRWDQALSILARVHGERSALFGAAHPLTLNAANNFLGVQVRRGALGPAASEYPALLAACEHTFGPDDPSTRAIRRDYADVLTRLGRHEEVAALLGASGVHGIGPVLLGCARLVRYTGLFPVAMTASRYGAELELAVHRGARTDLGRGREMHDDDLGITVAVVAADDLPGRYDPQENLLEPADHVADALGALGEHLTDADRELGDGRLRVRVHVHHDEWPRLSRLPSLAVDRRLMSARDRTRHDRLMAATPVVPRRAGDPRDKRRVLRGGREGFTVRLAAAPYVMVSTTVGVADLPLPSPSQV